MPTATASGQSVHPVTQEAVTEAVVQARAQLGGEPTMGFVFASPRHDLVDVMAAAGALMPHCELIGAQTAGEFTERGRTSGGISLMLTTLDRELFEVGSSAGVKESPTAVARELTAAFPQLHQRGTRVGAGSSTTVLLVDGLSGSGELLVKEVLASTRLFQQVVGGAAGDDGRFESTQVGTRRACGTDAAVALHVFGKRPWGVGVDHGLTPRTKPMVVTRARGNVVYEIDRKPALEVYRQYAASKGVTLTPENTQSFMIANELGVFFLNELHHARAPLGVGPHGELRLAADVMQGTQVCILDGQADAMVAAAERAAKNALAGLEGNRAAGVLVFDCICRGMLLGNDFQNEIDAIARVFPGTPIAGFLTYGEIARFRGKLDGWHNSTAVVVAIPA